MRLFFTGGSGKAGRHVIPYLIDQGHQVTNADLIPLELEGVNNIKVELTDSGQIYGALTQYADFHELEPGTGVPSYDAVVHFAAIPRILLTSDAECFRINTLSTYNVLEAALKLGIRKVIFASSETTYAVCFADGELQPEYIPIDEEHPTIPHDSYAMSKVCNEACGRSFHARFGADIYGLRINNVIEPHEYALNFPHYLKNPAVRRRNIFAYIDARDLGHMVDRCLRTNDLGYQVFNVANPDHSVADKTSELIDTYYQGVQQKADMAEDETFFCIDKARKLLDFQPRYSWRDVLADNGEILK